MRRRQKKSELRTHKIAKRVMGGNLFLKEHADPTGCLRPRSDFQTPWGMWKIGTKLKDTGPEIKDGLYAARKGPFICLWHRGKGVFGNCPCTGPCMSSLGILSCSRDYGSGFPQTFLFNNVLISLPLKGVKLLGGWVVGGKAAFTTLVQRRDSIMPLSV